ncbi:MAG: PLP-dependent aminotransferase family protein [Clostridiales bacterium]|nr:PLP-dependent aminotransferase family protein [Clostridiales bacterium]
MISDIELTKDGPIYLQIRDYIKQMILKGFMSRGQKLPSTRDLSQTLGVSRNTIILAYEYLEDEGFIEIVRGKGSFVSDINIDYPSLWKMDWNPRLTPYASLAVDLDIVKHEPKWKKGMISFKSIAPDDKLFDVEDFKRAFLNRFSLEGEKLLNYGYAQGYKPLIDYLLNYMQNKGVDIQDKSILITNGFTEGFNIILTSLSKPGDYILCENPTHNTALKIMKLYEQKIVGIPMDEDGINLEELEKGLREKPISMGFLIPSYHNPTGIVMSPDKRAKVLKTFAKHRIPIIEDGFNEELRYSGSHMSPLAALCGSGNSIIYIGSLSKVLFPGLRIGWILADKELISQLVSVKRSRDIHTSFLDQALLYEYLAAGNLDRYLKKARREYREKYDFAINCANMYIPSKRILGEGGLHIFVELAEKIDARQVLEECIKRNVIFMPGDIFYTDGKGLNTLRLGFARSSLQEIEKGFKIIGKVVEKFII